MIEKNECTKANKSGSRKTWFGRLLDKNRLRQNILMFLLMLLFGVILMNHVMSVRADSTSSSLLTRYKQRQADLASYQARYQSLLKENEELKKKKAQAISNLLVSQGYESLQNELEQIRIMVGFTEIRGKGITLTLDDKPGYDIFSDSIDSIVHDGDIRHAIDLLRASGAVAISINGLRYTNSSNIFCIGATIRCNQQRVVPPYVIQAFGDPDLLYNAVKDDQEFNIRQSRGIDLVVKVQKETAVIIPAYADADNIDQFIDMLEVVNP